MSLLNEISGSLLRNLSGTSTSTSPSSVVSSLNGKGSGASFDNSGVDVTVGLSTMADDFQASAQRIIQPLSSFQHTRDTVDQLITLTNSMIKLSKQSADVQTTDDQRGSINTKFQRLAKQFQSLLDSTDQNGFDYRSKDDLASELKSAGIDPSTASSLSDDFAKLAKSDGEIGYSRIKNEDVTVINAKGQAATYHSNGSTDPLDQDLTSQGGAQVAVNTLTQLQSDLTDDSKNVKAIVNELVAAGNFAIAGAKGAAALEATSSGEDPNSVAQQLVQYIRSTTGDPLIAVHSDLDRTLAAALLSDPSDSTSSTSSTSSSTASS